MISSIGNLSFFFFVIEIIISYKNILPLLSVVKPKNQSRVQSRVGRVDNSNLMAYIEQASIPGQPSPGAVISLN